MERGSQVSRYSPSIMSRIVPALALMGGLHWANVVHAVTLPADSCVTNNGNGGFISVGPNSSCGAGSVTATSYASAGGGNTGISIVSTYYYEVTAPQNMLVTASIQADDGVSAGGGIQASAAASSVVQIANGSVGFSVYNGNDTSCTIQSVSVPCGTTLDLNNTSQAQIETNTMYTITLSASVGTHSSLTQSSSAGAYADPAITVGPTTCPGCSVELSPGMVNELGTNPLVPVPLPASVWLMVAALGGVGVFSPRRSASRLNSVTDLLRESGERRL